MIDFLENFSIFSQYTLLQWALLFMLYCIFGWIFESVYCSLKELRPLNRGFCHGPWLPIYGVGAIMMLLFAWPYRENHYMVYIMGVLVGTVLELVTGVSMYHIFHMKWWDYSHNPFNFHGYICLYASLAWGLLALVFTKFIHPHVAAISEDWTYTGFVVAVTMLYTLFIEDLIFSVIGALDLKRRIEKLAENSEEIQALKLNISEARTRLLEMQEQARANVSEVKTIAETEGNLAAAKVVTEETKRVIATGSTLVAKTIANGSVTAAKAAVKTVAEAGTTAGKTVLEAGSTVLEAGSSAGKTVLEAGNTVFEAGTTAGKTVVGAGKSAARKVANVVPGTRAYEERHSENREGLELHRRRMEERLRILEDGGDERSGRMNWWVGSMLRNNPTLKGGSEYFDKLREAARKYAEGLGKLEARIEMESEKLEESDM
ncbi:putative membrane protein [Lachnospiraceae bacterium JC7]|nr:putative membrane protein [Lachnospiraceae bacterium JC7]